MTIRADGRIIVDDWQGGCDPERIRVSKILEAGSSCEGIDVYRYEASADSHLELSGDRGHIFSLLKGAAILTLGDHVGELRIDSGTHLYIPPRHPASFRFIGQSSAIHACATDNGHHGTKLVIHNERYLAPARFVLTPQYLSRRAFLNRDHTLVSRQGHRVAWFHTTMFDTQGLPLNHDGLPVFKMSYDHQTELNVVYEVAGEASVRFAEHPYSEPHRQLWSDWYPLSSDTTYYLNECADGDAIEHHLDAKTGATFCLRNRHEIYIAPKSHVSLCCLFDPGPTGLETHRPGEYSSYAPVSMTIGTKAYEDFLKSVGAIDAIIGRLSYEQASNDGAPLRSSAAWSEYEAFLADALQIEEKLIANAEVERRKIMEAWRLANQTIF